MPAVQALAAQYSRTAVVHAIRSLLSEMRQAMLEGAALPAEARQELSLTGHLRYECGGKVFEIAIDENKPLSIP
jgi:hypothetical protein